MKEHGVDLRWALWCRIRFLKQEIKAIQVDIEDLLSGDVMDPLRLALDNDIASERLEEMLYMVKEMKACEVRIKDIDRKREDITDEMIQIARNYPIDRLIEFHKGKALAWCHADKTPSLMWDRKRNKAKCWPCDKSFDTIAVLMERDNMQFKEAVKWLNLNQ